MSKAKTVLAALGVAALLGWSAAEPAQARNIIVAPSPPTDKAVVIVHGAGGKAEEVLYYPAEFLHKGYALAASDAGGSFTWGNPQSVRAYENLIRQLRNRGMERIYLIGGSMGGLATMQLVGRIKPEAVVLVAPVCDVSHLNPRLSPYVDRAWPSERPDYLSPVVPHPEKGLPVGIWHSREDTWVPSETNADVCVRELRARGARVQETVGTGDHDSLKGMPTWREMLRVFERAG